mgnify:CR=1 FL=1
MRAAPHGHERPLRDLRYFDRDLCRRRSRAHDQYAASAERCGSPVLVGVAHLSVEAARIRREPGAPERSGRDDDSPITVPRAVIERDAPPSVWHGFEPLYRGAEPDQRAEPERVRVGAEIGRHLAVVEEIAGRVGDREARVLHAQTGGVCAQ